MANVPLYIAKRYLLAKKGSTAVTIITWLAVSAMTIAVAAMFIIVSVFSGLEDMNKDLISNLHADLTIKSDSHKNLKNISKIDKVLKQENQIAHYSKIIEEKVYIDYKGKGDVGFLRGVDSAYTKVNPIDKTIGYGTYPSFTYSNEVVMENQLDIRLSLPVGTDVGFATLFMPKPGKGLINKEEDIFNKKEIFVSGVFPGNDQLDSYIIAPIELAQELLNLPKGTAYQIVIKLKNPESAEIVKNNLIDKLGTSYDIKTKSEENAAFWKMINTEKLFIYLIFALVIFITTFNLAGAIIILQLDKKEHSYCLVSLGFPMKSLRNVYYYTGLLIVIIGIISGLIIGTLVCLFQLNTAFFMANETMPFPVNILPKNYALVASTVAFFGILISWFFSKINKQYITNS